MQEDAPTPDRFMSAPERVRATPEALALIQQLKQAHGPLVFHQSGGCCDGSAPMCYQAGELRIGQRDVYLGSLEGCEVYIGGRQFALWEHTQLILDVVPGRGAGFSLEAPLGVRFLTRSRVFTAQEQAALAALGPPWRGPRAQDDPDAI